MKINQESREKILSDYERVNNVLFNILSGKLPNYIAEKDKYFLNQPLLEREAVLLTDDKGLFKYLKQTRDCLERLLIFNICYLKLFHKMLLIMLRNLSEKIGFFIS